MLVRLVISALLPVAPAGSPVPDAKLGPLLAQIDDIDRTVTDLEVVVRALDKYTDKLGRCTLVPCSH